MAERKTVLHTGTFTRVNKGGSLGLFAPGGKEHVS